ncbi:MAG: hypothetical protein GXP35_17885 [Actinobacteria bacterium]|nr:hypothetical protein [Actinomycetota bacterium]
MSTRPIGFSDDDRYDLGILAVLRVVAQRWWVIAIVLVLSMGMTVRRVNATSDMYAASAQVVITEASADVVIGIAGYEAVDPVRTIDTQIITAQTAAVWQGVWDRLGPAQSEQISKLVVTKEGVADVIKITVESANPRVAEQAASAFASSYVEFRKLQIGEFYTLIAGTLASRAALYNDQGRQLDVRIAELTGRELDEQFYRLLASVASPNSALEADVLLAGESADPELAQLLAERESVLGLQSELQTRADEIGYEASILNAGPSILGETSRAAGPLGTTPLRQMIVAAITGFSAGLALAFAVDYLDDRLRRRDVIEREIVAVRVPVLGATPMDRFVRSRRAGVVTLHKPVSATADAFRSIRSAFLALSLATPVQTLLVTSPDRNEGKTTVASELAAVVARGGRNVVLIDANLRRPRVHRRFDIGQEPGLSSVLAGNQALSACLVELPLPGSSGRLRVLPCGPLTDGITQVLDGSRLVEVLRAVQADADLVVIDAPHLNSISDAQVISGIVDGVVVVVRRGVTKRRRLGMALDVLDKSRVPVIWTVLNGFGSRDLGAARLASRRTAKVPLRVPRTRAHVDS